MISAFFDGWRRLRRAPWVIVGLWISTILLALPLAVTLHGMLADHLGSSLAAETAVTGVNYDWWNEFLAQAAGIGQSFVPAIIGFAAVMKNLSDIVDARGWSTVIMSAIAAQIAVSTFLIGGVMDRLARDRAIGAGGFFQACGVYFFRFLRLGVISAVIYWLLFLKLHPWMFDTVYANLIKDLPVERTAFFYRLAFYAIFGALVIATNILVDYAKVRAVVEDRRSMIGALIAGGRFVVRNFGAVAGVYAMNAVVFLILIAIYAWLAPSAEYNLAAFAVGQLYIVFRVVLRLLFAASSISLFQSRLAHAGYVATPVPAWPDSPAAEAVGPS